jgi:hypothetical protein
MLGHFARAAAGQQSGGIELMDSWTQHGDDPDAITFTGKTFEAGDLCLIAITGPYDNTYVTISGFTEEHYLGATHTFGLWSKVLAGTETTVTPSWENTNSGCTMVMAIFRGTSAIAGLQTHTNSVILNPDPPQITGVQPGEWVVTTGGSETHWYDAISPANYTMIDTIKHYKALYVSSTTMMSYRTGVTGTENPGAYSGNSADGGWEMSATTFRLVPD